MRLVAYLRVSTDKQAESGNGIDVQEVAIKSWARSNGHRIVAWLRDEGVCGADDVSAREALPEALTVIAERRAEGLVCWKLDRLARDLIVQETLLREIGRVGGQTFSTAPTENSLLGEDPNDPARTLVRQILGAIAQYERAMIVLRMKMGRAAKHAKGGYAYGAPAFGWQSVDKELAPLPSEQDTLTRMQELRAKGASYREIAAILETEGRPSKRGERWHPMTVARALNRPPVRS